MEEITNIRPVEIPFDNNDINSLIAELFHKRNILNEKNEFIDIMIFPTIQFLSRASDNEKFPLKIDPKVFTKDLGLKFNGYTYGIGKIIRLAEVNNDSLQNFIESYFIVNKLENFYEKSADCEKLRSYSIEDRLKVLTFGQLVNVLRNIIKVDNDFHSISELSNSKNRKKYRKTYSNYVEDRDCFTHGILYFRYPELEPILRVKDNKGNSYYLNYSKDIFESNLKTFNYLTDVLGEMQNIINKKTTANKA